MPDSIEGWVERLNELMEEMDASTISKAQAGNKEAQAILQAWALEAHAAALFLATYTGALQANVDLMIDTANTIIDTVQAILLAVGIVYLLKKLRRKDKGGGVIEIIVTEATVRKDLGDRTKPIPSRPAKDRAAETAFLRLRVLWTTHFLLTMMQGLQMQAQVDTGEDQELVWKATLDTNTCAICRFMHNKKSTNGDFMPVILKQFPDYRQFGSVMLFPHAHPRCRCVAVLS